MSTELVPIQTLSKETQAIVFFESATPQLQVKLLTMDPTYAEFIDKTAERMSASKTIPNSFQGKENLPALKQVLNKAILLGKEPSTLLDYAYVIGNKVALETTMLLILFNESGKWSILEVEEDEGEDIEVEYKEKENGSFVNKTWEGKNKRVRAFATQLSNNKTYYGPWISMELAINAGWYAKDNSQWKSDPDNMLRKRAKARFIKEYAPQVVAGMSTVEDAKDAMIDDQGDAKEVSKTPSLDKVVNKSAGATVKKTTISQEVVSKAEAIANVEEATVVEVADTEEPKTYVEADDSMLVDDLADKAQFDVSFELPPFSDAKFVPANICTIEVAENLSLYAILEQVKMAMGSNWANEKQYETATGLMDKIRATENETEKTDKLVKMFKWLYPAYQKRLEIHNAK